MAETVQQRVAEIRERVRRVTTGPWRCVNGFEHPFSIESEEGFHVAHVAEYDEVYPDHAALIANAPSDLAFLLDALGAAQKDVERLNWAASDGESIRFDARLGWACTDRHGDEHWGYGGSIREAIDAARESSAKSAVENPLPPQPSKP